MNAIKLPTFKGYTLDARLREFRKVVSTHGPIEFVPFSSPKGRRLLRELRQQARQKLK